MRNARSLVLRRETLSELTAGELAGVNGGSHLCATDTVGHGASFDVNCPTVPVNVCLNQITTAIGVETQQCVAIRTLDC